MNAKSITAPSTWTDPDDAPELTADWFATATPMLGDKVVPKADVAQALRPALLRRGRPVGTTKREPKVQTAIRFDADVLAGLRATGRGWQTRVNDAARDWLRTHSAV
jgi:uncharacterized protein (DUF4415 family)